MGVECSNWCNPQRTPLGLPTEPGDVQNIIYPPTEKQAFPLLNPHEQDLPGIFAEPLPVVVNVLESNATVEAVFANLPDIEGSPEAFVTL
jgi:hypothetical protein